MTQITDQWRGDQMTTFKIPYNGGMPLYEYACRACGHRFEFLTRADRTPACPSCSSAELEKQLSVFAVSSSTSSPAGVAPAGPCGACGGPRGPGACSIHRRTYP